MKKMTHLPPDSDKESFQMYTQKHMLRMPENGTSGLCMKSRLRRGIVVTLLKFKSCQIIDTV